MKYSKLMRKNSDKRLQTTKKKPLLKQGRQTATVSSIASRTPMSSSPHNSRRQGSSKVLHSLVSLQLP